MDIVCKMRMEKVVTYTETPLERLILTKPLLNFEPCYKGIHVDEIKMNQINMHNNMPANPNVVGQAPNVGMHMAPGGQIMQQPSPQQMPPGPAMPQQPPQDKMDNITKVKTLMASLREIIPSALKSTAQVIHKNHNSDNNSGKAVVDNTILRFDKHLEEFYSLCDQMELHLRTAITCIQQAQSAGHYLPLTVIPSRFDSTGTQETTLSYPQYLNTVRLQISYAKDIHDTLVAAAQNIAPSD